jgi:F-type H+-transporting ATPase subunit a
MRSLSGTFLFSIPLLAAAPAFGAETGGAVAPYPYEIIRILGIPVTNAMVTTLVVSILLIIGVRWMCGRMSVRPSAKQLVVETVVIGVRDLIQPIVGKHMVRPTFWLLAGLFTVILINNWSALLPGVGTFGHYETVLQFDSEAQKQAFNAAAPGSEAREEIRSQLQSQGQVDQKLIYYFRPGNSDLNTTLAMAVFATFAWLFFILRYAGPSAVVHDLFGNKAKKGSVPLPIFYGLTVIFGIVGIIEVISILFRPVSLSVRLFGNVFGGENLLSSMHGLFAYLLPVPFYFLELLIGFVQALVFTLLVAVYIGLITKHGEEEGGHH